MILNILLITSLIFPFVPDDFCIIGITSFSFSSTVMLSLPCSSRSHLLTGSLFPPHFPPIFTRKKEEKYCSNYQDYNNFRSHIG